MIKLLCFFLALSSCCFSQSCERVEYALQNLNAIHVLLPRIQSLILTEPEKAYDLISNVMKHLQNAEDYLKEH